MDFSSLLRSNGFLSLNKVLLRRLGLDKTMFICHLLDRREYYVDTGKIQEDGGFFLTAQAWEEQTGQSKYIFNQCTKWAEEQNLLHTHLHGIPMKKYFYVHEIEMSTFLKDLFDMDRCDKQIAREQKEEKKRKAKEEAQKNARQYMSNGAAQLLQNDTEEEEYEDANEEENLDFTVDSNVEKTLLQSSENLTSVKDTRIKGKHKPPLTPPLTRGEGVENLVVESKTESVESELKAKVKVNQVQDGLLPESVGGTTSKPVSESVPQTLQHPVKELSHAQRTKKLGGLSKEARESLEKEAEIIIDWYKESGKVDDQTRSRGKARILDRLLDGWRLDVLLTAIKRYVYSVDQEHRESVGEDNNQSVCADPTYFYGIGNFYGKDAHFLRYLDEEIDWEEKTNTPAAYELLQVNKFYRPLKAQYQEKYGDKWERELHKAKSWEEMWEKNKQDFQKMNPEGWEKDVYGDWEVPADPSLCPGKKIFARDWDENDATCILCPSREECKCDLARFTWTKEIVVDHITEKRLA